MTYFELFDFPRYLHLYRHGQYQDAGIQGSFAGTSRLEKANVQSTHLIREGADDFHSPCRPNEYLNLRVQKQLRFYQAQLPAYYSIKRNVQLFIVCGTFSSVILAAFDVSTWAALATTLVGGVTVTQQKLLKCVFFVHSSIEIICSRRLGLSFTGRRKSLLGFQTQYLKLSLSCYGGTW